ncbi:MAG: helix-turn-helix transcriptional regulator [Rhodobacteraceae bacterium]|jgi:DNA-binding CsgD family transcriptional regulator|nr:helix-turn-helix transcriptional regulator [Paracoccaceae bacterium]
MRERPAAPSGTAEPVIARFRHCPLDLSHDLCVNFHSRDDLFFTISSSRNLRPRDEAERLMLALLQPHLNQRFQLAAMAGPDHPLLRTASTGQDAPSGHVTCGNDGKILFAPEPTLEGLRLAGIRHGGQLPDEWLRWIGAGSANRDPRAMRAGLRLRGPAGDIHLHHLGDQTTGEHHLLPGLPVTVIPALTAREYKVARWRASGKTNREIALILERSRSSVKHHAASNLDKLMVENRATTAVRLQSFLRGMRGPGGVARARAFAGAGAAVNPLMRMPAWLHCGVLGRSLERWIPKCQMAWR